MSQWKYSERFSEASHEELTTLLWKKKFVRFLYFNVLVHVKGKYKLTDFTLYFEIEIIV